MQSVVWNEAVKVNGADPDFHRLDLWDAIHMGDYPEQVASCTQNIVPGIDFTKHCPCSCSSCLIVWRGCSFPGTVFLWVTTAYRNLLVCP